MSERYKAVEGSESAHCCFEATVVDTQTPHPMFAGDHDWVCECYDMETAQKIADALNAAQQPAEQKPGVAQLVEALEGVVSEIERVTCLHENTHRGGVLWEICEDCGAKWADDRGGKPEFSWPDSVEKARTLIDAHRKKGGQA